MKRSRFTMTEMLIVIAVIVVLAGILIPTLMYARGRARLTDCLGNQGQVGKIFIAAMEKNDGKITSGTGDKLWVKSLLDDKLLTSLDIVRCTELAYSGNDISDSGDRSQAYGVAVADNDAKVFNFKNNKLLRSADRVEIPRNQLLLGGCVTDDDNKPQAALDFDDNKFAAIHSGAFNIFFLDGSAVTVEDGEFGAKNFHRPYSTNSENKAVAVPASALRTN